MWPGIPPRLGLPLVLVGSACYGWVLAAVHPGAAVWWWGLAGLVALVSVVLGARQWRRNERIAEALAGRVAADEELAVAVDRLARTVDDHGAFSAWGPPLAVLFVASRGLDVALTRGEWLFWIPLAGIVAYAAVAVVLLRRRRRQVERWLLRRPPPPDWRSVPP